MQELSFSVLPLQRVEEIINKFKKGTILYTEGDLEETILEVCDIILTANSYLIKEEMLDNLEIKFFNEKNNKYVYLTNHCINEVCSGYDLPPAKVDSLISSALKMSLCKNNFEIKKEITEDKILLDISIKNANNYKNIKYKSSHQQLKFSIKKLKYKDAIRLYDQFDNLINFSLLNNNEFFEIFLKTFKTSEEENISKEEIFEIFKGNLALFYKIVLISIDFSYKNLNEKKVIFIPIM